MKKARILEVAVCGPGDVQKEILLTREVIDEWNQRWFDSMNTGLKSMHWSTDSAPSMELRGQAVINRDIIDKADILIAIFWKRLGTPTGLHDSGTVEEINRAIAQSKQVLIYFSDLEDTRYTGDQAQGLKLADFRTRVMSCGLAFLFKSRSQFKSLLSGHLEKSVQRVLSSQSAPAAAAIKRRSPTIQSAKGTNITQIAGDSNSITFKAPRPAKVSITPPPDSLTPAEQHQVSSWIDDLAEILLETGEKKSIGTAKATMWSRLKNKFKVSKYELIKSEQMPEVREWYRFVKREVSQKLKRKSPKRFSTSKITSIKAAMKEMDREKDKADYYAEISARLKIKPFDSLKNLSSNHLEKVYTLVRRDLRKFNG